MNVCMKKCLLWFIFILAYLINAGCMNLMNNYDFEIFHNSKTYNIICMYVKCMYVFFLKNVCKWYV